MASALASRAEVRHHHTRDQLIQAGNCSQINCFPDEPSPACGDVALQQGGCFPDTHTWPPRLPLTHLYIVGACCARAGQGGQGRGQTN